MKTQKEKHLFHGGWTKFWFKILGGAIEKCNKCGKSKFYDEDIF